MAKPIAPDYHTVFLFPPALEDWVPPDHYVRFLRELVDSLDLAALGFKVPSGEQGRPPYAASLLLKLWLFGYVNRLFTTRHLERAARENLKRASASARASAASAPGAGACRRDKP